MTIKNTPSILDILQEEEEQIENVTVSKKETPLERYLRTKKKLPPPNNPHTKSGKAWYKAETKRQEKLQKQDRIAGLKAETKRTEKLLENVKKHED